MGSSGILRRRFDQEHLATVDEAVALAEELTSDHFKYSTSQWRRCRYDIQTAAKLKEGELTDEAFAQIIRYVGQPSDSGLRSSHFDFYKICLQDHVILRALERDKALSLFPLVAYVATHELVHIVRFSLFLQSFEAYPLDRAREEALVHKITREILESGRLPGVELVAKEYWESMEARGLPLDLMGQGGKG